MSILSFLGITLAWTIAVYLAGLFTAKTFVERRIRQTYHTNTGETLLRNKLVKSLASCDYHILNNITVPCEDGTTQIDHIVISRQGIFVIETKHYKGWIFGKENAKYWTQTFYNSKHKFQNPLRQNYKHLLATRELIKILPNDAYFSCVVFTGKAEFKTLVPKNVFSAEKLISAIKSAPKVISYEQMMSSIGKIEHARYDMTKQTDIEHVNYLNLKFGEKPRQPSREETLTYEEAVNTACIKCGNFGDNKDKGYWACSDYPSCETAKYSTLTQTTVIAKKGDVTI